MGRKKKYAEATYQTTLRAPESILKKIWHIAGVNRRDFTETVLIAFEDAITKFEAEKGTITEDQLKAIELTATKK